MDTLVWQKRDGKIYYDYETGYFSAMASGWDSPDDFTIIGIYALAKDNIEDQSFEDFKTELYSQIKDKEKMQTEITQTDLFWIYLGNRNYFYLTGQRGECSPYDDLLLDEDEQEKYCISYDSKVMESLIDKTLIHLSKNRSLNELADDCKKNYIEVFINSFINNNIFEKTKLL